MNTRRLSIGILCSWLAVASTTSFTGCNEDDPGPIEITVTAVADWTVGFVTDTGEYIWKKSASFANALSAAWNAFWDDGTVTVDSDDPLKGTHKGTIGCFVAWGEVDEDNPQGKNTLDIKLHNPKMVRSSVDSDWELAPEEKERITTLQETLMNAAK